MSAIDRRLDKLEDALAPPTPPVKWRRVIANDITEAEAAALGAAPDERLIVRLIISRPPVGTGERDNVRH